MFEQRSFFMCSVIAKCAAIFPLSLYAKICVGYTFALRDTNSMNSEQVPPTAEKYIHSFWYHGRPSILNRVRTQVSIHRPSQNRSSDILGSIRKKKEMRTHIASESMIMTTQQLHFIASESMTMTAQQQMLYLVNESIKMTTEQQMYFWVPFFLFRSVCMYA